jgi:formylglycine-generating enzyme required for sulfatase activity
MLPDACYNDLGFRVAIAVPAGNTDGSGTPRNGERSAAKTLVNSLGMKFVLIPAGQFMMGNGHSFEEEAKAFEPYENVFPADNLQREYPRHPVRITRPFYLGENHVTRGQFARFVEATGYKTDVEKSGQGGFGYDGKVIRQAPEYNWRNTGFPQTDDHPVVNVSWNDAIAFCDWLGRKEGVTYRLPTEAEWEYAARAGTSTRFCHGDDPEILATTANVADAAYKTKFPDDRTIRGSDFFVFTSPVGSFPPNGFGLYDMDGNVCDWCWDWYDQGYYAISPIDNPQGAPSGTLRVDRGGGWSSEPYKCEVCQRFGDLPSSGFAVVGFRVARTK